MTDQEKFVLSSGGTVPLTAPSAEKKSRFLQVISSPAGIMGAAMLVVILLISVYVVRVNHWLYWSDTASASSSAPQAAASTGAQLVADGILTVPEGTDRWTPVIEIGDNAFQALVYDDCRYTKIVVRDANDPETTYSSGPGDPIRPPDGVFIKHWQARCEGVTHGPVRVEYKVIRPPRS